MQGLQAGDILLTWDELKPITSEHMSQLPSRLHEGVPISLDVRRLQPDGRHVQIQLTLVPSSRWDGNGLLGCHIVPV